MNKNITLSNKAAIKTDIAIFCAIMMLSGFLFSRALLSFSTVLFGINALWGTRPKDWLKNKWWLIGIAWVGIYVISGLWTENISFWEERVSVKLPILLLPISFSMLPAFSKKQIRLFTIVGALLFMFTIGYSLSFLFADPSYYIEQYRFSKVLPTLAGSDYIRYSLSIALFIIWSLCSWEYLGNKLAKMFVGFSIVLLSIYVHVIAVKTGILVLYTFFFLRGLYVIFTRKAFLGIGLILMLGIASVSAYKYVPTFQQKVDYFRYSWKVLQEGHYDSNYSDIGRLVSYDITGKVIGDHWLVGCGAGDVLGVMSEGYDIWYPKVPEERRLMPHNQFMIVALGCGVLCLLVFIAWIFYPLKWVTRDKNGFYMFSVWFVMFIPLMTEPFLELQFGIYVYLFFLLMHKHHSRTQEEHRKEIA